MRLCFHQHVLHMEGEMQGSQHSQYARLLRSAKILPGQLQGMTSNLVCKFLCLKRRGVEACGCCPATQLHIGRLAPARFGRISVYQVARLRNPGIEAKGCFEVAPLPKTPCHVWSQNLGFRKARSLAGTAAPETTP